MLDGRHFSEDFFICFNGETVRGNDRISSSIAHFTAHFPQTVLGCLEERGNSLFKAPKETQLNRVWASELNMNIERKLCWEWYCQIWQNS